MHDRLFGATGLTADTLNALPQAINLNQGAFEQCLGDRETAETIDASIAEASLLGIRSTPTFLFGRITEDGRVAVLDVLSGTKPFGEFVERLDATLAGGRKGWWSWIPFVQVWGPPRN
jgi:predicted DsbA family dithiol-disulfide isomerase